MSGGIALDEHRSEPYLVPFPPCEGWDHVARMKVDVDATQEVQVTGPAKCPTCGKQVKLVVVFRETP